MDACVMAMHACAMGNNVTRFQSARLDLIWHLLQVIVVGEDDGDIGLSRACMKVPWHMLARGT